jgi:class 3 adenylate cyclase
MEHRTVAILAADIVGYSRLLERDQDGTLSAIAALQKRLIAPLLGDGRLFRLLGDGSLFEFQSAQAAVKFAIAVQQLLRSPETGLVAAREPLSMRMGVHFGAIVVDGSDLHGEGVTTAARLEAMAPEGGLCISEAVHTLLPVGVQITFTPLGPRLLKNIESPVSVWRWVSPEQVEGWVRERAVPGVNGRQILDPRVTDLLFELHMRSARLGVSDAIDEILCDADEGRGLPLDALYQRLGAKLNPARDMLDGITAQCTGDDSSYIAKNEQLTLGRYVARVFDNARTAFAFRLLPQISDILRSELPVAQRRRALMTLIETFMFGEMLPRLRALIAFAFVDS